MKIYRYLMILLTCSCYFFTSAQEAPPTLGVGLSGLIGSKGNIDIDVLADIIVGKQDELKKEAIKEILRKSSRNGSYTFYSFSGQCMTNLFDNKDITATKRKLVENLSNLAMVYGFSEFYLRTNFTLMANKDLRGVISACNENMLDVSVKQYWQNRLVDHDTLPGTMSLAKCKDLLSKRPPGLNYRDLVSQNYNTLLPYLKDVKDQVDYLFEKESAPLLSNHKNFYSISNFSINQLKPKTFRKQNIPLSEILLDMVYDIMIRNNELEKLGFFKVSRAIPDERYQEMNKYLYVIDPDNETTLINDLQLTGQEIDTLQVRLLKMHDRLEREVSLVIGSYQMVKELTRKGMSINELLEDYKKRTKDIKCENDFNKTLEDLIKRVNDSITKTNEDSLWEKGNEMVRFLKSLLTRSNGEFTDFDTRSFTNEEYPIKTRLQALGIFTHADDQKFDMIYAYVWYSRLKELDQKLRDGKFQTLGKINLATFSDFTELLKNLGSLDKAGSYDEVFKIVMNAGYMYDDYFNTSNFNQLIGTIEKYSTIDTKNNKIDLNVETIILALYEKWSKRSSSCLSFYFTIGLNQSMFGTHDTLHREVSENNFAFASEKIGIRYKWYNVESKRANYHMKSSYYSSPAKRTAALLKEELSTTPLIKNYNFSLYGSGLMYNIINSTTREGFKAPMIGLSTGIQFFNGLEFNVFVNVPLYPEFGFLQNIKSNQFCGIAFDVPIADYINGVRKKRKEEQDAKEKAKAEAEAEAKKKDQDLKSN